MQALLRPRLLVLIGLVLLGVIGFEEIYDDIFNDPLLGDLDGPDLDRLVTNWVYQLRSPRFNQVMTDLTALGSFSVTISLFFILASVLLSFRDFRGFSYMTVVLLGAGGWPHFLKPIFNRPRPDQSLHLVQVSELSFPSGHSFGAAALYFGLSYMAAQYARGWKQEVFFHALGALVIALVGISRIYLGVHYPTDVAAGLCGGVAWAALVSAAYEARHPLERWHTRYERIKPAPDAGVS